MRPHYPSTLNEYPMLEDYKKKREFEKTPEPLPKAQTKREGFSFVVQLHDASHLHYDLRLELDGVLKSWAIPKGPSLDPKDKRLAMMVEDHPLDYQYFEGTIPPGNYGAGTVMIWDRGTYGPEKQSHEPFDEYVRGGLKEGKFSFNLYGRKLKGSFALFRFGSKENQWMLIKHSDRFASSEDVRSLNLSVKTGFSLPLINALDNLEITLTEKMKTPLPKRISPMLATFAEKPVEGKDWLFEIKWDGYRAISKLENGEVNLYSRNLQSFNAKFPEIAAELKKLNINAVIDGEVVALDEKGMPRFNLLQNIPPLNLPLSKGEQVGVVYYCFDLIYFEGYDLRSLPLMQRKQMLFRILPSNNPFIKYVDHVVGEGKRFYEQASKMGLEGIIGKKNGSTYQAGKRSSDWIKIKTAKRQEAVIGGYTAPRGSREG
ncbi:MAG TPA: DNA polymerase ligase N-terminal domain-containing protein, partial [bacterium]|nr:DNA polymerase ligase N-terminal domain-containing protein [bacterium]